MKKFLVSISLLALVGCTSVSMDDTTEAESNKPYTVQKFEEARNTRDYDVYFVDERSGCLYYGYYGTHGHSYEHEVYGSNGHVVGCRNNPDAETVEEYFGEE